MKVDGFYTKFNDQLKQRLALEESDVKRRSRKARLSDAAMMSIYLLFHFGQFSNFKHVYIHYVCKHLTDLFPDLVSYEHFNARQHRILIGAATLVVR